MKNDKNSVIRSNFGTYGWFLIIFSILLYAFSAGINVTGLNLTLEYFTQKGWNYELLLRVSSYGGYVGIAAAILCGWFMNKAGMRMYFFVTILVGALGCVTWGYAATPAMYFVGVAVVSSATNGFAAMGTSNLMAIFFPRKKGVALGWSTMGLNISDILYLPVLSALIKLVGVPGSYLVIAIIFVVLAVIALLFVKNSPEEKGIAPDNMPISAQELEQLKEIAEKEKHACTFRDVLSAPQTWIVGICFGLQYICCSGILSQSIVYLTSEGVAAGEAVTMFSIAAVCGVVGSYVWGAVDGKVGPRKASILLSIWFAIGVFLMVLPFNKVLCYISIAMFLFAAGGVANVNASIVATQFGRFGFAKAFGIINPIVQVFRVTAFLVLGLGMSLFGGVYNKAFIAFLICALLSVLMSFFIKEKPIKLKGMSR